MVKNKPLGTVAKPCSKVTTTLLVVGLVVASFLQLNAMVHMYADTTSGGRNFVIKRRRAKMREIETQLGPYYFRRSYRMSKEKFHRLANKLRSHIRVGKKRKGPNGFISPALRLSAALRYFAGGSPYDILLSHGLSHSSLFVSVWAVVDAVNKHPDLAIGFPTDHAKQRAIARGFMERSDAGFDCCAGAIDGMLVWTEKPSEKDCDMLKCGSGRFMCGRKHKFGFNMQGVCDHRGRFLDLWILNPASSSDYIAFIRSKLYEKITSDGFLADGLALFGDNAYVSTEYMVTPYRNIRAGLKDDFNYFQSQVRIEIECAFGMLVQRWAILRKALPSKMGVKKQIALTMALCKLHNFCLGEDDLPVQADFRPTNLQARDELNILNEGGVELNDVSSRGVERDRRDRGVDELLDAGEHFDDVTSAELSSGRSKVRQRLLNIVEYEDLHRSVSSKARLYG